MKIDEHRTPGDISASNRRLEISKTVSRETVLKFFAESWKPVNIGIYALSDLTAFHHRLTDFMFRDVDYINRADLRDAILDACKKVR